MHISHNFLEGSVPLLASLIVLPPCIWLGIRTQHCLRVISVHAIPFQKRTVWLVKILALIVGVGGLFGAAVQVGLPWVLPVLAGGAIIFLAFKENVQGFVPSKTV